MSSELEKDTFGINAPFKIPDDEYFLMGENRDNSYDSRFRGTVPRTLVVGKPTMIYWTAHSDRERNDSIRWNRIFSKIR